jgi:hypothetical protein
MSDWRGLDSKALVAPACKYTNVTSDTLIKTGKGVVYGIVVTAALSAATIEIRDATAAAGGTVLFTVAASAAIGTIINFGGVGIQFNTGLFADFNGTGTINVLWL